MTNSRLNPFTLIVLVVLGAGASPAPAAPVPRDQLVALVTKTLQAWQNGEVTEFVSAFTPDAVWAYPGGKIKRDAFAKTFTDLLARKTAIKIYIGDFIVQGDDFAVQYQFAATDRVTGRRWAVGTGLRGTLRDGHIAIWKEYWDEHIPAAQLSRLLPLDEGQIFPAPASVIMTGERVN